MHIEGITQPLSLPSFPAKHRNITTVLQATQNNGEVYTSARASLIPWHEATSSINTLPWIGCQSISRFSPCFPDHLPVPIYIPRWREALGELSILSKDTTSARSQAQISLPGVQYTTQQATIRLHKRIPQSSSFMYL